METGVRVENMYIQMFSHRKKSQDAALHCKDSLMNALKTGALQKCAIVMCRRSY